MSETSATSAFHPDPTKSNCTDHKGNKKVSFAKMLGHVSVASRPRARLTESQVLDIFEAKGKATNPMIIGAAYGVSEKAVRDIWKGRTWNLQTKHLDPDRVKLENKQAEKPKAWKDQKPQPAFSLQDEGFSQMILASEPRAFPANVSIEDASLGEVYSSGTCHTNSAGTPSFEHDPASRVDRILWEWDRGCALPRELCDPFKDDFSIPALTEQML